LAVVLVMLKASFTDQVSHRSFVHVLVYDLERDQNTPFKC
jgi:hypothetical protein